MNNSAAEFTDENETKTNHSRRSFLLTYAQADLDKFPSCLSFAQITPLPKIERH